MPSTSLSLQFAELLLSAHERAAQPAALEAGTHLAIDGLAVAALGSSQPGPRILARLAIENGGAPVATLIGHAQRVSAAEAARANGAAMHVLDFEPMWNPANHSLSTTLPAVLALAETALLAPAAHGGRAIIQALVLGIEAQQRMRRASGQLEPGGLLFHPPGAVGAFGSAVACGLLLGLDAPALAHALGIAASRAAGIQGNIGSMTKALHCGQSALAGLEAARLAMLGFTADADALGGARGYGRAFYGDGFDPAHLLANNPELYVVQPGPAFKFFPSQYGTHFVITAMLEARRGIAGEASASPAETVSSIRIVAPHMPYVDRPAPVSGLDGKFSFQYVAAVALLDGAVNVASFSDARRFSPDVESVLPRIRVEVDPDRKGRFDQMAVDVFVEWASGRTSHGRCDGPPGIWGRPAPADSVFAKAEDCLAGLLGKAGASGFVADARHFTDMDLPAVRALLARLGSGA